MQAIDPPSPLVATFRSRASLAERVEGLGSEVAEGERAELRKILADEARTPESVRDALSTRLMEVFRLKRSRSSFGLLYELNSAHLLGQVTSRLRRYASKADPLDVLQEVFFNVFRYPHRFDSTREDAFRVWSAMIVRNTVIKHIRGQGRGGRQEVPFEDLSDQPVVGGSSPLRRSATRG